MSTTEQWGAIGASVDVITNTEMSALANNTAVTGATAYDNSAGPCFALITLTVTMAVGAGISTGFSLWILKSHDGTNYESATTVYRATQSPVKVYGAPTDTTQAVIEFFTLLPPGKTKYCILNNATGQATKTDTTSAGSKVTVTPVSRQSV